MAALGVALAALIGLSLGLLGGGGSILTVPIFVYVLGFGAKEAIAMSLAVVGAVSLFGAAGHWRVGNINLRVALAFGSVAMVGTYLGARLAVFFSGAAQLALFAVVMLLAAFFMFREKKPLTARGEDWLAETADDEATSETVVGPGGAPVERMPLALIIVEGLAVGVLTGLVGVGGGFLIVPALVLLARVPMKQAVGTSLLVIAMKSATGFLGYLGQVEVPWAFMTVFTAVAITGILLGTYLVQYVSQGALKRAFAIFLVVMGGFILYQNRGVLLPHETAEARSATGAGADPQEKEGRMDGQSGIASEPVSDLGPYFPNAFEPLEGVLTGGQLTEENVQRLAEAGYGTIVDLRLPHEPRGFDERAAVEAVGMEYLELPVGGMIRDETFDRLRALLQESERHPLVVHCASGNRVGAALIPYLVLDRRMELAEALEIARQVGLRSPALAGEAIDYVNRNTR